MDTSSWKVIKRGHELVDFNEGNIKNAVNEALKSANDFFDSDDSRCDFINHILEDIQEELTEDHAISVETIQDIIENNLMEIGMYDTAREFIKYRYVHKRIREYVESKEEFIKRYKGSSNTANATVDDNSNVASKNIGILNNEIHKPDNIHVSRGMVMRKYKELYPGENPKQYIKDLDNHIIYKHDESSFAGAIAPYTYSSKEVVEVLYNDRHLLTPFDLLYDIIEEPEILVDSENIVYQKLPDNLFVKDSNGEFVRVTHITKKKRHRDLYRIKTCFGEDLVVTDNHPLIISSNIDDTIQAKDSIGKEQYKCDDVLYFNGQTEIDLYDVLSKGDVYDNFIRYDKHLLKRILKLDEKLGYIIGFFIGDGNYNNNDRYLNFSQKDQTVLRKINEYIFDSFGTAGYINYHSDRNIYSLELRCRSIFDLFMDYFKIQDKAQGKTLPINILEFNEDFAKGILEGLYDADGTVNYNQIYLKLASRAAIMQVSSLMRYFKYTTGNGIQSLPFKDSEYHTNYTLWTVGSSKTQESASFDLSFKWSKMKVQSGKGLKYRKQGWVNITNVQKIQENDSFLSQNEYIYDITTDSHTFCLNNIMVHNCCSISMYPFLNDGIKGLGGLSCAPKNLDSFCGMYVNLIFAVSSQFAGAVATSEFLLYFDYFARKEFGENYINNPYGFYKIGPKMRELLDNTHYWTRNVEELRTHDFGSDKWNKLRDEIVYNSQRPLTEDELKDYLNHVKEDPNYSLKLGDGTRTIGGQIHQYFQQVIYSINQPAAARGMQSAFVNFSYFDKPFFDGMFGNFVFPDMSKPIWESLSWLQKDFMQWFNQERLRTIITFPVESFALVYKDGKFLDEDSADFVAEEYARGHSFFTYISDSVDSLSSCCFSGDEVIKIYDKDGNVYNTSIKDFVDYNDSNIDDLGNKNMKEEFYIDSYTLNGDNERTKITGTLKKKYVGKMYKIYTDENNYITVTPDHILKAKTKTGEIVEIRSQDIINNYEDYELVVE